MTLVDALLSLVVLFTDLSSLLEATSQWISGIVFVLSIIALFWFTRSNMPKRYLSLPAFIVGFTLVLFIVGFVWGFSLAVKGVPQTEIETIVASSAPIYGLVVLATLVECGLALWLLMKRE